jgi:hypothetical protein
MTISTTQQIQNLRAAGVQRARIIGSAMENNRSMIKDVAEFSLVEKEGYVNGFLKSGKPAAWLKKIIASFDEFEMVEVYSLDGM